MEQLVHSMTVLLKMCPQMKEAGELMKLYSGQKATAEGYSNTVQQVSNNMEHSSNKTPIIAPLNVISVFNIKLSHNVQSAQACW